MKNLLLAVLMLVFVVPPGIVAAGDLDFDVLPDMEDTMETAGEPQKSYRAFIGLGPAIIPDYEGSEDYEALLCPYVRVHWQSGRHVEFLGVTLKANLVPEDKFEAGPLVRYDRGRDDVENNRVDAMRDVDDGIEVGGFATMRIGPWDIGFELAKEVADGHDGVLGTIRGGYTRLIDPQTMLSLGASLTFADDEYMDSYFTVDAVDAGLSRLKRYDADSGLKDIGLNCSFTYRPSEKWSFVWANQYKKLSGDAADSPVADDVGSVHQFITAFMLMYSF